MGHGVPPVSHIIGAKTSDEPELTAGDPPGDTEYPGSFPTTRRTTCAPNLSGDTPDGARRRPWRHGGPARRGARPSGSVEREWEGAESWRCSGEHDVRREGRRRARWRASHASRDGVHAGEGEDGGELLTMHQNNQGGAFGGGDDEAERWPGGIGDGSDRRGTTPRVELGGDNGDGSAGELRAEARVLERGRERARLSEGDKTSALATFAAPAGRRHGATAVHGCHAMRLV